MLKAPITSLAICLLQQQHYLGTRASSQTTAVRRRMPKASFYAVHTGRKPGIYSTWTEAESQVKGFQGAKYKKFPTEVAAKAFVATRGNPYSAATRPQAAQQHTNCRANGRTNGRTVGRSSPTRSDSPTRQAKPSSLPENLAKIAEEGYTFAPGPPPRLVVYTDGSGLGNGKKGALAGLGVFWGGTGKAAKNNLAERVPGPLQTNNRGELLSIIRALETCPYPELPLEVRTDSKYSINCMTVFIHSWIKNGWRTNNGNEGVKNADMIRHLLVLLRARAPAAPVNFKHVRGHSGHEGNEAADKLARCGAMYPALPDRTDWLDPDAVDESAEPSPPQQQSSEDDTKSEKMVDLEVDPSWLMDEEELAELANSK